MQELYQPWAHPFEGWLQVTLVPEHWPVDPQTSFSVHALPSSQGVPAAAYIRMHLRNSASYSYCTQVVLAGHAHTPCATGKEMEQENNPLGFDFSENAPDFWAWEKRSG